MEKKHETLLETLLNVTNYVWYRFLSSKIQILLDHQKTLYVRISTLPLIFVVGLSDYKAT